MGTATHHTSCLHTLNVFSHDPALRVSLCVNDRSPSVPRSDVTSNALQSTRTHKHILQLSLGRLGLTPVRSVNNSPSSMSSLWELGSINLCLSRGSLFLSDSSSDTLCNDSESEPSPSFTRSPRWNWILPCRCLTVFLEKSLLGWEWRNVIR